MTLPAEWIAAALVGVDRAGPAPTAGLPEPLADLAAALAGRPAGIALLLLAGAAGLYDDAGRLPARAPATEWYLPAFRAEGDLLPCSPAAARLAGQMLNRQETDLLPEWLTLVAAAGRRAPDDLLPAILDYGARATRQRPLLLSVIGERGRWLAAINPAWRYAAVDLADWRSLRAMWDADPPGRAALAHSVRARDPETARHLIETTWRGEPDATRRELASVLSIGVSLSDEPFLERALDDRDAQVRHRSAELLARLEGSRLVRRMVAAAGEILVLDEGELRPNFPPAISDALARDGVTRPSGSAHSANDRSRLLSQTVGVIPPRHWEASFGVPPEVIIRAAAAGKWPRTLISALAAAAARHADRRWATALLDEDGLADRTGAVIPLLAPQELAARLRAAVAAGNDDGVVAVLRRSPAWDEAIGRLIIDALAAQAAREPETRQAATLRYLSRQFARQCPPALAGYAATALSGRATNKVWEAALSAFLSTLARRQRMVEAME